MKVRRHSNRIDRTRAPNLRKEGQRYDQFIARPPTFFSKIDTSFRMLEQSLAQFQEQLSSGPLPSLVPPAKKNQRSLRLQGLAAPKQRSSSVPDKLNNKKQTIHLGFNGQNFNKTNQFKKKPQPHLHRRRNASSLSQHENQITGCNLVTVPIGHILSLMKEKQNAEVDKKEQNTDSEDEHEYEKTETKDKEEWNFPETSLTDCLDKIIGGQGQVYENYDKRLMEKIDIYRSKEFKLGYQNSWK